MTGPRVDVSIKYFCADLNDLRDIVESFPKELSDQVAISYDSQRYRLELVMPNVTVTGIECGDHLAGDYKYDLLVETHQHDDSSN
jgi:hypothetical protein